MKKLLLIVLAMLVLLSLTNALNLTGYSYKRNIILTNNTGSDLNAYFPFDFNANHLNLQKLVDDGNLQADWDDLRFFVNLEGSAVELPRAISMDNNGSKDYNSITIILPLGLVNGASTVSSMNCDSNASICIAYNKPTATTPTLDVNKSYPFIDGNFSTDNNKMVFLLNFENDWNDSGYRQRGATWVGAQSDFNSLNSKQGVYSAGHVTETGQYLTYPIESDNSWSVSLWAKLGYVGGGAGTASERIFGTNTAASNCYFELVLLNKGLYCKGAVSSLLVSDTAWHHWVITKTVDNRINYYLDGQGAGSFAAAFSFNLETTLYIFNGSGNDAGMTDSIIDQFALYNYTLNQDEITKIYRQSNPNLSLITFTLNDVPFNPVDNVEVHLRDVNSTAGTDKNITVSFYVTDTNYGIIQNIWWKVNNALFSGASIDTNFYHSFISYGDQNVCVIVKSADTNKQACEVFKSTQVIVKVPLDEIKLFLVKPYTVGVDGNTTSFYNDINVDTNAFFFTASTLNKSLNISSTGYTLRSYSANTDGTLQVIQPYLLSDGNSSTVKFVVQNERKEGVQSVLIKVYKTISGSKTLITSGETDATGTFLLYLVAGDKYELEMTFNNKTVYSTTNFVVHDAITYFYINTTTYEIIPINQNQIKVDFTPAYQFISASTFSIKQSIYNFVGINHVVVKFFQYNDFNEFADKNYFLIKSVDCNAGCSVSTQVSAIPFVRGKLFWVEVFVYYDNNTSMTSAYTHSYTSGVTGSNDLLSLFKNVRRSFGCDNDINHPCGYGMLVSIVLTIFLLGGIAFKFGYTGIGGLMVLGLLALGFFTYVGWFYWIIYAVIALVGVLTIGRGAND